MEKIFIILKTILPVFMLIGLGVFCRKKRIFNEEGILSLKALVTKIMLPILIFNTLATAKYSIESITIFSVALICLALALLIGFKSRGIMGKYSKYSPFLMACSETGMVGYALVTVIVGSENLYYLATMDLASTLFGFTIFITLLSAQSGGKPNAKETLHNMLHTPSLIASIIGIAFGLCGFGKLIEVLPLGIVYKGVVSAFTLPISTLILISIGFSFSLDTKLFKTVIKATLSRFVIMGIMLGISVFCVFRFVDYNRIILVSIIVFFTLPPTFVVPVYVKEKEQAEFISACISVYMIITMVVFTFLCICFM